VKKEDFAQSRKGAKRERPRLDDDIEKH